MSFMIETSARHIHLTQETVEKLFGKGYELTIRKPHQDQKRHTVQSLTLHQAPDTRQNTRDKDHAVDDILPQPDLFQFSHVYSPFLSPIFSF